MKSARKLRGRIQRASMWSHRSQRKNTSTDVTFVGHGDTIHRNPQEQRWSLGPYVTQILKLGNDVDITITFDLADAERMHAQLAEAIAQAKVEKACGSDCYFCKEPT